MIKRDIEDRIRSDFGKGKVVLVLGARQVGKTTLLDQLASGVEKVASKLTTLVSPGATAFKSQYDTLVEYCRRRQTGID